jgi:exopolyphosphatase/guanosine-5'-triphosphate,3'-diphosphate pyrophosphatase
MNNADAASTLPSPPPPPAPGAIRRAVIDVGTNSVKLLVADVSGGGVQPLEERSEQTRLGRGFYPGRRLQPAAVADTARSVADFAARARELGAVGLRVIATSAARDAVNPAELASAIRAASGLSAEIISGEQEADWVFRGVVTDPAFATEALLIVDVGGGSTEFILGEDGRQQFRHSFALGTVRLMEQLTRSDPPTPEEWLECRGVLRDLLERQVQPAIASELATFSTHPVKLVGTGGTASIMARIELGLETFDRERIEALRLTREQVRRQRERLWSLSLAERRNLPGLPPDRADVILTGVPIYETLMERFGFSHLRASTRGLRFAALLD